MRAASPICSVTADHPVQALWAYEQERLPMTAQIVRMNRKGGPEGVIDAVEERAPDGFTNIDDVLSYEQRKAIVRGYASAAGFAQTQVNRPMGEGGVALTPSHATKRPRIFLRHGRACPGHPRLAC